jgi:hypothetical protein
LTAEGPPACIAEGDADHDGQLDTKLLHRIEGCDDGALCHQGVEDGLDEDEVDSPFDEEACLLEVAGMKVIEIKTAVGRIIERGGEGEGMVGRPHDPGDECTLLRLVSCNLAGASVDESHLLFQTIFGKVDAVCTKGIGLDDIGSGLDIGAVDVSDDLTLGQVEDLA